MKEKRKNKSGVKKKNLTFQNTHVCLLNAVVSGIWKITTEKITEEKKNQDWIPKLNISLYKQQWFHWAFLPILDKRK